MVKQNVSKLTQRNWWIDAGLALSALAAALSGIYFLFLPVGGYMGGRNPYYNVIILFERHTWEDIHVWGGIAMVVVALVHLVLHWSWVATMARRSWIALSGKGSNLNARGWWNLTINTVVALSFLVTAITGLYLFVVPGHGTVDPVILFTRTNWDLIHTWAGVILVFAAVIHFYIHWMWVTKVTRKMFTALVPGKLPLQPAQNPAAQLDEG